jgi:hypothetical protein
VTQGDEPVVVLVTYNSQNASRSRRRNVTHRAIQLVLKAEAGLMAWLEDGWRRSGYFFFSASAITGATLTKLIGPANVSVPTTPSMLLPYINGSALRLRTGWVHPT